MKVQFTSLGCDKNLSDSEHMLYLIRKSGLELTDKQEDADVIVINTCCFIESALEESINAIINAGKYKTEGHLKGLVVCGCMSERYREDIRKDLPEVDAIVGTSSYDEIVDAILSSAGALKKDILRDQNFIPEEDGRISGTGEPYDYLKIADGCDKYCTYCLIPYLRGHYRSIPMENLLKEAEELAESGITEINLVAQETTLYGTDIYGKKMLPELLRRLSDIRGIQWIRLLYCYPESIDEDLVAEMAANKKVVHYIDMPIQHCNSKILKSMNRHIDKEGIIEKIRLLRSRIPDIAIRTTLIAGFPGETDEMHEEMLSFVKDIKFDRLGVFPYSREKDTRAYDLPGQVDEKTKEKRRDMIMAVQQSLVFSHNKELIGKIIPVFVEGFMPDRNVYAGRTYMDAPDVDSYIFFTAADPNIMSGRIVNVKVTDFKDYDLYGELVK